MSKREAIVREVEHLPEQELDAVLAFLNALKHDPPIDRAGMLLSEASLAKDWLTPEEDSAWANL